MNREKAERQRDALEEELTYQLNRLDGYVGSEDRTSKIKKAIADVQILMEKLTKTIEQLAVDASEGPTNADKERMEKVQEKRDKAVDAARKRVDDALEDDQSQSTKRASTVKKTSSTVRKRILQAKIEEQKRQSDAEIDIRRAEMELQLKQEAEIHRQKLQALQDESNALDRRK